MADASARVPDRSAARPALRGCRGLVARMVRTAAHGEDRRRSAGDHREDFDSRLTVHRSITELAHLAGLFNHVLDRLSSALTTQRRFMADASHELRTPVSIARTAAQVTLASRGATRPSIARPLV